MSFRDLVEPECGGANPLMRMGAHVVRDAAYKDEGFLSAGPSFSSRPDLEADQMVNEFLGQIPGPPNTFRMDELYQELREIDAHSFIGQAVRRAPPVIDEVNNDSTWAFEFHSKEMQLFSEASENWLKEGAKIEEIWPNSTDAQLAELQSIPLVVTGQNLFKTEEAGQLHEIDATRKAAAEFLRSTQELDFHNAPKFSEYMENLATDTSYAYEFSKLAGETTQQDDEQIQTSDEWINEFMSSESVADPFQTNFWNNLQEKFQKISDEESPEYAWLTGLSDFFDPYKEYKFNEENPMAELDNAFERGKVFLTQGDIPSAVLCFEAAVKKEPEKAEIWQFLGNTQAENEKDPNAIAAYRAALELEPNNMSVLMAMAVSYTNENMQYQAIRALVRWLKCNEKYSGLVPDEMILSEETGAASNTMMRGPELREVQNLFLAAVNTNPEKIDADIQEALGVLFNLSYEYDKAVDCFQAALHVRPDSAKVWNRLGASLANGNRSVEATDAYQRALALEPGNLRVRYNVGIICINLRSYKEAVEHCLTALNIQATALSRSGVNEQASPTNNCMSETIWGTVRMAVSLMGRHDLQSAIDSRDLDVLNKEFDMSD